MTHETAFYGPHFRSSRVSATGGIRVGSVNPETEVWARGVVKEACEAVGIHSPSLGTLQIVQAVGRLEGFYGKASKPPEWAGSNNWGAVHCCKKPPDGPCPPNSFESQDFTPKNGGKTYRVCMKSYPTPLAGCVDMVRTLTRTKAEREALAKGDVLAMSTAMYDAHYYESPHAERDKAIAWHATTLGKTVRLIADALKEPIGTGASPPQVKTDEPGKPPKGDGDLAPLLLGMLPIGAFLGVKVLSHMVGDPLIITPDMAREKIREVDANYKQTSTDYSHAINRKKITLERYRLWTDLESRWLRWSEHRMGVSGDGISPATASADYAEAKVYDLRRFEYAHALEAQGLTPPDRPPEKEPPKAEPGTLDGENPLTRLGDSIGGAAKIGAVVGGLYLAWKIVK